MYEDGLTEEDILELVKDIEPYGIEANYIYVDRNDKKINDITILSIHCTSYQQCFRSYCIYQWHLALLNL